MNRLSPKHSVADKLVVSFGNTETMVKLEVSFGPHKPLPITEKVPEVFTVMLCVVSPVDHK